MSETSVLYTKIPRLDEQLLGELAHHGVSTVFDALGPAVARGQTMPPAMVRRTTKGRLVGPAITVWAQHNDNLMAHVAIRYARPGDVIVIAGTPDGALWGELMATRARAQGVAGVVIDGCVRDVDSLEEMGFPVWATTISPMAAEKGALGCVNEPVSCAGVRVEPGDIIVADGDGVIVVPFAQARSALVGANDRALFEAEVLRDTANGRSSEVVEVRHEWALAQLDIRDRAWSRDLDADRVRSS